MSVTMTDLTPITKPATGKDTDAFRQRVARWLAAREAEWVDQWQDMTTGERPRVPTLCNAFQAHGHIVKWAHATGRIDERIRPPDLKHNQRDGFAAAVFYRSPEDEAAVIRELNAYIRRLKVEKRDVVRKAHPELFPEEWADEFDGTYDLSQGPPTGED